MKVRSEIILLMTLLVVFTAVIFSFVYHNKQQDLLLSAIDDKLISAAYFAKETLPENYHNTIINKDSISPEAFLNSVDKFNQLCLKMDLEYLWSLMLIDNQVVFTSATSTSKDISQGDHANFFEVHSNPELYINTFTTMQPRFQINDDKWGRIRVVLVPFNDANGNPYLFGASMKMMAIDAISSSNLTNSVMICFAILCVGIALSLYLANSMSKPITALSNVAKNIAEGDLKQTIEITGNQEVASLSRSIDTMRKAVHEKISQLKESNDNLQITLNSISDGVITTDAKGNVTSLNPVAEELTGWTTKDAFGQPFPHVFNIYSEATGKICENPAEIVLRSKQMITLEKYIILITRDGTELQITHSGAPILDLNDDIVGVVLVFRDVTEQNQLQAQAIRTAQLASLGELAAGVAHEINNPIGGVINYADILKKRITTEKELDIINRIINEGERIAEIVRKLLLFSRDEGPEYKQHDIHALLDEPLSLMSAQLMHDNIEISVSIDETLVYVRCNAHQIEQILLNLLCNSRHALNKKILEVNAKKVISIVAKRIKREDKYFLLLEVRDNGVGIPADVLPRVLNPFYTTKEAGSGTGLGLSISAEIIQGHNGTIAIDSVVGEYTKVIIEIPLDS